ncbi:MAG: radical SAM protein [Nitrospinales bacterium]
MARRENSLLFVFWEATTACNLECVHCRRLEIGKKLSREDLATEEVFWLIQGLAADFHKPPIVVLSGGEPLIRPDIFDIAEYAERMGVSMALATNGTLIDREVAGKIAASAIRRVSISLDGANAETHDRFRRMPGSFAAALRGIRHLRTVGVSFQINTTLTRQNLRYLDEVYRLSLALGADALYFFLLVPVGCGLEIKEEAQLSPEEYEAALQKIHGLSLEGKIHVRPICAPHYFRVLAQNKSSIPKRKNVLNRMSRGCLAGTGICFISHKGEVFPCGYLPEICGNVRERSLKHIWENAAVFSALRDPELLQGKCGLCRFKRICTGCRARAYEESGNFLAEEPNCLYQPQSGQVSSRPALH